MSTVIPASGPARLLASALALTIAASGAALSFASSAAAATPASGCQSVTSLDNGGFETPAIPDASYSITPASTVPGWETTDPSGIELWSSGFLGVPAAVGRQFAELNATEAGTLFQEVATQPGQSLQWSLLHRGRGGIDVMDVLIGAPGGDLASQGNLSDGMSAWGRHTGIYIVPAGQTVTRFGFRAVSTGSGNNSIGNFLDDISFGTGACVVSTSAVSNATRPGDTVHVGDVVEYSVTAENQGGSRAILATLASTLPAGLDFLTGSMRTTSGPSTGGKTDAAGDDSADYTLATRTVNTRLGDGATSTDGGSLAPQQSTTFVFRARVTTVAALTTISTAFAVEYTDSLSGTRIAAATPALVTPVAATADLGVAVAADAVATVAGASTPTAFTVTVTNAGPQTDSAVTVAVTPPAQLTDPTVSLVGGTPCPIVAGVASCVIGDLASGASTSIWISGTVEQGVLAGTALVASASVVGAVFDSDVSNDASSASTTVSTQSDLWMRAEAESAPIYPGADARMGFVVGNTGASTARDIVMQVELPLGFEAVPSAGTIDSAGNWSIPSLASGETQTIALRGRITRLGRLSSAAWLVSSSTADDRTGNERAVASALVEAEPLTPLVAESPDEPSVSEAAKPPAASAAPAAAPAAAVLASTGGEGQQGAAFALLSILSGLALMVARRHRVGARHRA